MQRRSLTSRIGREARDKVGHSKLCLKSNQKEPLETHTNNVLKRLFTEEIKRLKREQSKVQNAWRILQKYNVTLKEVDYDEVMDQLFEEERLMANKLKALE